MPQKGEEVLLRAGGGGKKKKPNGGTLPIGKKRLILKFLLGKEPFSREGGGGKERPRGETLKILSFPNSLSKKKEKVRRILLTVKGNNQEEVSSF